METNPYINTIESYDQGHTYYAYETAGWENNEEEYQVEKDNLNVSALNAISKNKFINFHYFL